MQYFSREAGIWRYSESHPNILKLFGYVLVPGQTLPSLVSPYYGKGSARAYIRNPENKGLPTRERIRLVSYLHGTPGRRLLFYKVRDIARGLEFRKNHHHAFLERS